MSSANVTFKEVSYLVDCKHIIYEIPLLYGSNIIKPYTSLNMW